jgi:hypothetical protein
MPDYGSFQCTKYGGFVGNKWGSRNALPANELTGAWRRIYWGQETFIQDPPNPDVPPYPPTVDKEADSAKAFGQYRCSFAERNWNQACYRYRLCCTLDMTSGALPDPISLWLYGDWYINPANTRTPGCIIQIDTLTVWNPGTYAAWDYAYSARKTLDVDANFPGGGTYPLWTFIGAFARGSKYTLRFSIDKDWNGIPPVLDNNVYGSPPVAHKFRSVFGGYVNEP